MKPSSNVSGIYALVAALVMVLFTEMQAIAATYTYSGNDLFDIYGHNHAPINASVDLNCVGPCAAGTYSVDFGITYVVLGIEYFNFYYPGFPGALADGYLTLDSSGLVVDWNLSIFYPGIFGAITTSGDIFDTCAGGSCSGLGPPNNSNPGTWTSPIASPTALPTALPLFASGLGALGLLGLRRRRRANHQSSFATALSRRTWQ